VRRKYPRICTKIHFFSWTKSRSNKVGSFDTFFKSKLGITSPLVTNQKLQFYKKNNTKSTKRVVFCLNPFSKKKTQEKQYSNKKLTYTGKYRLLCFSTFQTNFESIQPIFLRIINKSVNFFYGQLEQPFKREKHFQFS